MDKLSEKAEKHIAKGEYDDAINCYTQLIDSSNNNSEYLLNRAKAYLLRDNGSDRYSAYTDLSKFIETNPNNADGYFLRGKSRILNIHGVSHAIPDLNKAIELNPNVPEWYYIRGKEHNKIARNKKEALSDYEKYASFDTPKDSEFYFSRAYLRRLNGMSLEALEDYNEILKGNPNSTSALTSIAEIKSYLKIPSAIDDINRVLELEPDKEYHREIAARIKYNFDEHESALKDIKITLEKEDLWPDDSENMILCSRIHLKLKNYKEAFDLVDRCTNVFQIANEDLYVLRGEIFYHLGKYDEAISDFNYVLPNTVPYKDSIYHNKCNQKCYYFLGLTYLELNDKAKALENLKLAGEHGYKIAYQKIVELNLNTQKDTSKKETESDNKKKEQNTSKNALDPLIHIYPNYTLSRDKYIKQLILFIKEVDYRIIKSKVNNSAKLDRLINELKKSKKTLPGSELLIRQICTTRGFRLTFNYNKITLAAIFLYDNWVREVALPENYFTDEIICNELKDLILQCDKLASGK